MSVYHFYKPNGDLRGDAVRLESRYFFYNKGDIVAWSFRYYYNFWYD